MAVALALALVGAVGLIRPTTAAAMPDTRPYVDAAKATAQALTTVDYRTVDRDVQRILDSATNPFYDEFEKRSADFTQTVMNAKSTSTGTIDDARLESFDNGQALVFVTATVVTVNEGQPPKAPRQWRLTITVQKVSESFKAATVEFQP